MQIMTDEVPDRLRITAAVAVHKAAGKLGISVPRLQWWDRHPNNYAWYAWTDRGVQVINLNLACLRTPDQVKAIVHHEARHIWQDITTRFFEAEKAEDDANEWAYRETRIYLPTPSGWESVRQAWRD